MADFPSEQPSGAVKPLVSLDYINDEACKRFIDPQRLGDWIDGARWGVETHAHKVAVFGPPKVEPEPSGAGPTDAEIEPAWRAHVWSPSGKDFIEIGQEMFYAGYRARAARPAATPVDLEDWALVSAVFHKAVYHHRKGHNPVGDLFAEQIKDATAALERVEARLHPAPPEPADPCREAWVAEFGSEPVVDDPMWIGWVRCWKVKP